MVACKRRSRTKQVKAATGFSENTDSPFPFSFGADRLSDIPPACIDGDVDVDCLSTNSIVTVSLLSWVVFVNCVF